MYRAASHIIAWYRDWLNPCLWLAEPTLNMHVIDHVFTWEQLLKLLSFKYLEECVLFFYTFSLFKATVCVTLDRYGPRCELSPLNTASRSLSSYKNSYKPPRSEMDQIRSETGSVLLSSQSVLPCSLFTSCRPSVVNKLLLLESLFIWENLRQITWSCIQGEQNTTFKPGGLPPPPGPGVERTSWLFWQLRAVLMGADRG